jgi:CRISPR system Cascade subunit CasE
VVSNTNPDYDFIQVEYDATATVNTTVYDGFLNALDTTSKYRFVFTANPIINKKKTPDQKRGNRVPLIGKSAREWVIRKLGESGFENIVLDDIHDEKVLIFKKNGTHTVKIRQQTYSGIVTIVNVDQVRNALLNGLGSEKAYGCGMVTLIPVR